MSLNQSRIKFFSAYLIAFLLFASGSSNAQETIGNDSTSVNNPALENVQVKEVKSDTTTSNKKKEKKTKIEKTAKINESESSAQAKLIYRRSSLCMLMITDEEREFDSIIKATFDSIPIPEKFNDHTLEKRFIKNMVPDSISNKKVKILKQTASIKNYVALNFLAREAVGKWFNQSYKGFNMDLISERGSYDASAVSINIAKSTTRGLAMLADAGEELIKNTFIVVNDYKYVNKEEVAAQTNNVIGIIGALAVEAGVEDAAEMTSAAQATIETVGKGYVIRTRSYLFRLRWNDSIAAVFYNNLWSDVDAFDESKMFSFDFIGYETAWADVQSTTLSGKSNADLIKIATIKATDASLAKLQRKYEEFRTKTPLFSGDPIAAKIGLKEGLEKGDKYEVLEQTITKDGRTVYRRKGVIKVDGKNIWDNRFSPEDEVEAPELTVQGASESSTEVDKPKNYTLFKGPKGFYSGMLIKQIN